MLRITRRFARASSGKATSFRDKLNLKKAEEAPVDTRFVPQSERLHPLDPAVDDDYFAKMNLRVQIMPKEYLPRPNEACLLR